MPENRGTIVLMGSGELTATMVEVHKSLLRKQGRSARAVFLDTPAGFQLNADHIAQKAAVYFNDRVQHPIEIASFKSALPEAETAALKAFELLRRSDYLLIGPGSPTYALAQWQQSPVPQIIIQRIEAGGCLVAASAAALTIGTHTLPVYEIYKVGMPLHWAAGMDILGHFGFNLVVMPHWNNAEGGNHDTRYCFMGAPRLAQLESMLDTAIPIIGIDEHTALILDLANQQAVIQGVGQVTVRWQGQEYVFAKEDHVPLSLLQGKLTREADEKPDTNSLIAEARDSVETMGVWDAIHRYANNARTALDQDDDETVAHSLLDLERHIWSVQSQLEDHNEMGAAREVLREVMSLLTAKMAQRPINRDACMTPLVEALLHLRRTFRSQKKWEEADALRHCLQKAGVVVEDGPEGAVWKIENTAGHR